MTKMIEVLAKYVHIQNLANITTFWCGTDQFFAMVGKHVITNKA